MGSESQICPSYAADLNKLAKAYCLTFEGFVRLMKMNFVTVVLY